MKIFHQGSNILFIVILATFFYSCDELPHQKDSNQSGKNITKNQSGNQEFLKLLEQSIKKINIYENKYTSNFERAEYMKAEVEKEPVIQEKVNKQVLYCKELIRAGKNESAIMESEKLLGILNEMAVPKKFLVYPKKLAALAYMRAGENSNCIEQNNSESCIIPFTDQGLYSQKLFSSKAISHLEELLKINSEEYEAIWLLNIAHMTMGTYPKGIKEQFRIDEKLFVSKNKALKFKNVAPKLGIDNKANSGGVCMDDFNNDGFLDIVVTSWGVYDQMKFFVNKGDGTFKDNTQSSGLKGFTGGLHITHCDYNNDGWLDLFVLRGAWFDKYGNIPNSLLKNNGDGTFTDVTIKSNLLSFHPTQVASWADFNNDGWLDVFIGNEQSPNNNCKSELYLNKGDGTFQNVFDDTGISTNLGGVKGANVGDINNDGLLDLYVSVLNEKNSLYINEGQNHAGVPKFKLFEKNESVANPLNSFSVWFWDYNNDGWEDIFVGSYISFTEKLDVINYGITLAYQNENKLEIPIIYLNEKGKNFRQIDNKDLDLAIMTMGSNFGDINNDGYEDFYLGNGNPSMSAILPNKMYLNNKRESFSDVSNNSGLGHIQKGHGISFGDIDNDGDQDIFLVTGGAYEGDISPDALFVNPGNKNNWVTLKMNGSSSNKFGIGARVKLIYEDSKKEEVEIYKTVGTGSSFGSNSLQVEIGLAKAKIIKRIEISWPNKTRSVSTFDNIEVNKVYEIEEETNKISPVNFIPIIL